MERKQFYCENLPAGLPVFHQPFWLDTVCPGEWDVALVIRDNKILASMPYHFRTSGSRLYITMPLLTQFLGPFFADMDAKAASRISYEMELMEELLLQLPSFSQFNQNWHYSVQNWLPFYWKKFSQTSRYTYLVSNTSDIDSVWKKFRQNTRWEIRKAEKHVAVSKGADPDFFFRLIEQTFEKQNLKVPYSSALIHNIFKTAEANNTGESWFASDQAGNPVAAIFLIWDQKTVYYLMGGFDKSRETHHAMSLLLWKGIQVASEAGKAFDFEGSMLPGVEKFFRSFGGELKSFFRITKRQWTKWELFKLHAGGALKILSGRSGSEPPF